MNEKSLWVQTTDKKKWLINPDIIASSNLLLILNEKYMGSFTHPLIIPQALSMNRKALKLYCSYSTIPAKNLRKDLTHDSYFKLIDAAEKLKALKIYIDLVTEILPKENESKELHRIFQGNITQQWINHLLIRALIKKQSNSYTFPIKKVPPRNTQSYTIMSNNGTYLIHNFCNQIDSPQVELYNTRTKENESLHPSQEGQRIYCSPNNKYIIIVDLFRGIYIYNILTKKKHFLYEPYNQESDIIISDNSKYILSQQLLPFNDYKIIYKLWSIEDDMPQEIDLGTNLSESKSAIFHPDNEHIFHLNKGKLCLHNIATGINTQLNPKSIRRHPKNFEFYDTLMMSFDKKHIICRMKNPRNSSLSDHFNYVVLNIENITQPTFTILPPIYKQHLPPLCIPHKDLITHCADKMNAFQLLNEKQILIASHERTKHHISAIASDKNGNYLACGYSDGLILLWNISDLVNNRIIGKRLVGLNIPVKNLVFTDNHLLFSHAKPELFVPNKNSGCASLWNTQGDQIIDFGSSVSDANINGNGSFITIVKSDIQSRNTAKSLELTCYDINQPLPAPTLKQAYNLLQESKK